MKMRILLMCFLSCLLGLGSVSCSDYNGDAIWDIFPFSIYIEVTNEQGEDLLNLDSENSIADNGIKAIYEGVTYEKDSCVAMCEADTRAILVIFRGLQTYKRPDGRYVLTFGEFKGERDYDLTDIIIDWNDGSKDVVSFRHSFKWKRNEPHQSTDIYLNGKKIDGFTVHIIK